MTVGPIEGTVLAISRELDAIGGYAMTRLTAPVVAGLSVWPVESTLDFPSSGSFVARGTLYTYTAKTAVTLEGVQFTDGVTVFTGAKIDLRESITITDFSRVRTSIDLLRRAMLVNFADGRDLNVVGANLGVSRLVGVPSDAIYREIIKALAYNPRGTIFGIEVLLTALLGAGNFAIVEDLISEPNKVFVQLLGTAALTTLFTGKAFLNQSDLRPEDSATQVTLAGPPVIETVYSVVFKNEDNLSDFRNQLPSAESITEFPGDAGTTVWAYNGPSEGADVTQVAGLYIEIDDSNGADVAQYRHNARTQPSSDICLNMLQSILASATVSASATSGNQWGAQVQDDGRTIAWGVIQGGAASEYDVGFIDITTGSFISGAAKRLTDDIFFDVEIRKKGLDHAELYVDGALVQTEAYTSFPTTTETRFVFGANDSALSGMVGRVKQVGFFARTPLDFWASRGTDGEAFPGATTDKTFDDATASDFLAGDVGKRLRILNGTTLNPESGTNNGIYEVDTFSSASRVTLRGQDRSGAFVQTGTPTTFFANDTQAFQFPDDLGKEIVITGSANNDGTFVITDMISESDGTTSLLTGFDSQIPEKTGIVKASSATFVTETGLAWRADPVFVNETGLDWELSDTGTEAAGVLTLRQAMPALSGAQTRILRAGYTDVLSAQLLEDNTIQNLFVGPGLQDYSRYPFYLSDPLGVVRSYLDIITVAGVIPELLE